ncbi:MAG: 16S rRNA (guanine(966)-N(2))-methyltransferase RsmD [bacterium]
MRIISGTKRGVRLITFKNLRIRPTTDRTKELIFNVINNFIKDSFVLDIYAGTGSLGIEALSRGAAKAIFIENHQKVLRILKNNIEKTEFTDRAVVLKESAENAIKKLAALALKFDVIFADPPYIKNLALETIKAVNNFNILQKRGILIVESSIKDELRDSTDRLTLKTRKRLGDTTVSFYQYDERE